MKYFGVPTCPYCKKRVNLIRTWSLKRQGEYRCPRCGGISNIFLSPLIHVAAVLAVFAGGTMYFFHKFVLDDVSLQTLLQVFLPFAVFFFLSLFMVYLVKPVIKTVPKADLEKKKRSAPQQQRQGAPQARRADMSRRPAPGPVREQPVRERPVRQAENRPVRRPARPAGEEYTREQEPVRPVQPRSVPQQRPQAQPMPQTPQAQQPVQSPEPVQQRFQVQLPPEAMPAVQPREEPIREAPVRRAPVQAAAPVRTARQQVLPPAEPVRRAVPRSEPVNPVAAASGAAEDDFFAKYNDPEYVERRLRELRESQGGGN